MQQLTGRDNQAQPIQTADPYRTAIDIPDTVEFFDPNRTLADQIYGRAKPRSRATVAAVAVSTFLGEVLVTGLLFSETLFRLF